MPERDGVALEPRSDLLLLTHRGRVICGLDRVTT